MTKVYIDDADELHDKFGQAITKAWEGVNSVVEKSRTHEACHVARFVYGAPAGMVAAIKKLRSVQSAEVRGMFCHKSPFAFWDDPDPKKKGLVRCELADLMVEVEVVRAGVTASRALLVQLKKANRETKWKSGVKVSSLDLVQRYLFHALPSFCVELSGRPTKDQLVRSGVTSILGQTTLLPYALAGFASKHPGGLVYAAVNPAHQGPPSPTQPWLAEDGRPQNCDSSAVFTEDFARALAEMVAVDQTRFGVRTQPLSPTSDDWSRLIHDLKDFATWRATEPIWNGDTVLDVVLDSGKGPNNDVLYNVQHLVSQHGHLLTLCSHASSARKPWPSWRYDAVGEALGVAHKRMLARRHQGSFKIGEGPPFWPPSVPNVPWRGFGVLQVRVTVSE